MCYYLIILERKNILMYGFGICNELIRNLINIISLSHGISIMLIFSKNFKNVKST